MVEAGEFYEIANGNISQVPGLDVTYAYPSGGTPPLVDWGFTTEPQKVFTAKFPLLSHLVDLSPHTILSPQGYNDRLIYYPQGKTLGGS